MNISTSILLAGVALTLSGCGDDDSAQAPGDQAATQEQAGAQATETEAQTMPERETPTGTETTTERPETLVATVIGTQGDEIGSLIIHPRRQGVRLDLHVEGLEPGTHAVHFHETGRCETPDFASAGGHYNPADAQHGMPDSDEQMDDQDHHAGDMLNQTVDDNGMLDVQMVNQTVTIDGDHNPLLDEDGSALVIHANADDYESQPSGAAGPRVACAVISA